MSIFSKLAEFNSIVTRVKKDKQNPHFKNSYADINSVLEAIIPPLSEAGIVFSQMPSIVEGRNALITSMVDVESEESILTSTSFLPDGTPQQIGSAISYYRRYHLVSMLGLQMVDDDAAAASNPIKDKEYKTISKANEDEKREQWGEFKDICERHEAEPLDFLASQINIEDKSKVHNTVVHWLRNQDLLRDQLLIFKGE